MKNKTNYYTILFSIIILFACNKTNNTSDTFHEIDLVSAYKNKQNIKLSEIVKSIEYVQLSSKDSLVSSAKRIFVDEENIVVVAFKQQFLFDRKSGDFIHEIGRKDKAPGCFRSAKFNLPYNESRKTVYARGWKRDILEYSIDGKVLRNFEKPDSIKMFGSFVWLNDSIHVCYEANFSGEDEAKLIFLNRNSNKLSTITTNDKFEKNPKFFRSWGEKEGWFYRFNEQLFFKELFNDTIFNIEYNKIIPKYKFLSGDYTAPSYRRNFVQNEEMNDFYLIEKFFESKSFVFFTLDYKKELRSGLYDKKKNEAFIVDSENPSIFVYDKPYFGFENDIDNFIPFCPQYMNENNEIVASVEAYELVTWFNENPEKAAQLPLHLQKLKNIKETDNPVVMIAKLKE